MLASPEIKAFIILFGISALLLGLHAALAAAGSAAFAAPWTPDAGDGSFVLLTGTVGDVRELAGGHLIAEVNGTQVFIPASAAQGVALAKGDRVQVAGTVQTYQGRKEVVVKAAADVVLI
ncbi:MAG: hypothetical protein PHP59_07300 [Methanofollis sp.]|uniref:hypothetical protein n=1 Tax=Methanofollis sp. TaxID=2052835 RepID=UPI0026306BF6|nr:hypothetical protein [Methanofollis sp.]MDD4255168.1 hypothetical protein [Methanofollis sp.]